MWVFFVRYLMLSWIENKKDFVEEKPFIDVCLLRVFNRSLTKLVIINSGLDKENGPSWDFDQKFP